MQSSRPCGPVPVGKEKKGKNERNGLRIQIELEVGKGRGTGDTGENMIASLTLQMSCTLRGSTCIELNRSTRCIRGVIGKKDIEKFHTFGHNKGW